MPEPKSFGAIRSITKNPARVDLILDNGLARVQGIGKNVIRLRLTTGALFLADESYAIESKLPQTSVTVIARKDEVILKTPEAALSLDKQCFSATFQTAKGESLSTGLPFEFTEEWVTDVRSFAPDEECFGLGERISPLGRRGYLIRNWNADRWRFHNETDANLYSSLPFMISVNKQSGRLFGYFLDVSYLSEFDLGNTEWDTARIRAKHCEFNVYFFSGSSVSDLLREYTALTGRHAMPPVWAIGFHQCRWSYLSTQEAGEIADTFRKKKIPCDVIWYDIDYMDNFRVFTFNPKTFGDMKAHLTRLKKQGFRSVVIVDPGVKIDDKGIYDVHDEGTAKRYFIRKPDGSDYEGKVWPGGTKFPDFTRPEIREWWGALHQRYYDVGVDAFWNDMNEIADLTNPDVGTVPNDLILWDNGRWSMMHRLHNVYANLEAKATVDGMLKLKPETRPFLLTRAAFAGIQKYSAKWCGDNTSSWDHLRASIPQIINMGLSGVGFVGDDVGGFGCNNTTPELLARWTQAGLFYPFFRNHAAKGTIYQEPWRFGKEVESVCREAIRLRYHLLPYFYQLFHEMHRFGHPVARPLFWENENDPRTYGVIDQIMLGRYVLGAPVLERGAVSRKVYLPQGIWYHYLTGAEYEGGKDHLIEAPLNSIPLFVKAGAVLPAMKVVDSTQFMDKTRLELEVFAGDSVKETYYEDDMETNAYQKGDFALSPIVLSAKSFSFTPAKKSKIKEILVRLFRPSFKQGVPQGFKVQGLWAEKTFSGKVTLKF